ncbi:MAG: hypothetical protein ABIN01_17590 [Ferruginibacter sp.]
MSNNKEGIGEGILKGLKKILFTDSGREEPMPTIAPAAAPAATITTDDRLTVPTDASGNNVKEMKLRVYQLLESINKPGCDFFEVWNASVEMGGANSGNIKAAYTSLKYADKTLTKDKLLETGDFYISSLTKVLDAETIKRQEEKDKLLVQKDQEKTSLTTEINELEKQIAALQKKLAEKKTQNEGINQKYQPQLEAIDAKISNGHQSVNSVINEMQQVVAIIQKEIN